MSHHALQPAKEAKANGAMKQITILGICAAVLLALSGCMSMHTNTRMPGISEEKLPRLQSEQPVAFRNGAPNVGDIVIGKWTGWTVYGDLHKYTESTIAAAKNVLERQNISVKDNANKSLELTVYSAESEQGWVTFRVRAALRVKTGDGLVKEFQDTIRHANGYGTTSAMERTLARCVVQMYNDPDVLKYLEN